MADKAILVIDPHEPLGNLIAEVLSEEGYRIRLAQSLAEASDILNRDHFDLIITEAFDQTDQFTLDPTFLNELRRVAPATPIILCSTYPSVDILHPGDFGLAEILAKPFSIDELSAKVRNAIQAD